MDRLQKAMKIKESGVRLESLIKHKAPEMIIEKERQLLFKKLMKFPINLDGLESSDNIDDEMYKERENFLFKHGFYKDIEAQIDADD